MWASTELTPSTITKTLSLIFFCCKRKGGHLFVALRLLELLNPTLTWIFIKIVHVISSSLRNRFFKPSSRSRYSTLRQKWKGPLNTKNQRWTLEKQVKKESSLKIVRVSLQYLEIKHWSHINVYGSGQNCLLQKWVFSRVCRLQEMPSERQASTCNH